jgi:hypothetical protein
MKRPYIPILVILYVVQQFTNSLELFYFTTLMMGIYFKIEEPFIKGTLLQAVALIPLGGVNGINYFLLHKVGQIFGGIPWYGMYVLIFGMTSVSVGLLLSVGQAFRKYFIEKDELRTYSGEEE